MKKLKYAILKFVFFLSPVLFSSFNPDLSEGETQPEKETNKTHIRN